MKCSYCSKENQEDSIFCSECGRKIKKDLTSDLHEVIEGTKKNYFILGFLRGLAKSKKKEPKWFTNFETHMKKIDESLFQEYTNIVEYWKDFANSPSKKE